MNRPFKLNFLCTLAICLIVGCSVSTKMTLLDGKTRSPISPGDVIIFEKPEKVTGDYEEIGLITSHGDYQHTDLAEMYGVETKVLNQAVKRNLARFPSDFMFQLSEDEFNKLRSQMTNSG